MAMKVLLHDSMHLRHTHTLPDLCLLMHRIDTGKYVTGHWIFKQLKNSKATSEGVVYQVHVLEKGHKIVFGAV